MKSFPKRNSHVLSTYGIILFQLFCGSESYSKYNNNKYGGCINSTLYIPSKTLIKCEGEGCYGPLNISLNTCNECINSYSECINKWNLYCGNSYSDHSIFSGDSCNNNNCSGHSINTLSNAYINNDILCNIFETDFICKDNQHCIINCHTFFND